MKPLYVSCWEERVPGLREDEESGLIPDRRGELSGLGLHNPTLSRAICQPTEQARKPLPPSEGKGQNNVFFCFPVSHRDWVPPGVCETLSNPLITRISAGDEWPARRTTNLLQSRGSKAMATHLTSQVSVITARPHNISLPCFFLGQSASTSSIASQANSPQVLYQSEHLPRAIKMRPKVLGSRPTGHGDLSHP